MKYKEGTLHALSNGWEQDYKLRLYKDTVLDPDGDYADFTEATATTGYTAGGKTLAWDDATITWDSVAGKYKATWAEQTWTAVTGLDADGWYLTDSASTRVYVAEEDILGSKYTKIYTTPEIILG
jgi:hypothetical protein